MDDDQKPNKPPYDPPDPPSSDRFTIGPVLKFLLTAVVVVIGLVVVAFGLLVGFCFISGSRH